MPKTFMNESTRVPAVIVFINELVRVHDNIGVIEKPHILTFNCWDVARSIPWHWSSQTSRSSPGL